MSYEVGLYDPDKKALAIAKKHDAFLPEQVVCIAECENIPLDEFEDWLIKIKPQRPNLFSNDVITSSYEVEALIIAEKYDAFCPMQLVEMARGKIPLDQFETWVVAIKPYEPGLFCNSVVPKNSVGE